MNQKHLIPASLLGTLGMTLYSHWRSRREGAEYREHVLLDGLSSSTGQPSSAGTSRGWALHCIIGLIVANIYNAVWKSQNKAPSLKRGAVAGAVAGPLAVLAWQVLFSAYPQPPRTPRLQFYRQLVIGHIIFGTIVGSAGAWAKKRLPDR